MFGIGEIPRLHALDGKRDGERLVRRDNVEVLRIGEFGGGHIRRGGDGTHRCGVA